MGKRFLIGLLIVLGVAGAAVLAALLSQQPAVAPTVPPPAPAAAAKPVPTPQPPQTTAAIAEAPAPTPASEAPAPATVPDAATPAEHLTAETLKDTSWKRDDMELTLAADGSVVIGEGPRAKWTVEGNRVKLYSTTDDEVHYLDIKGNKLYWNGLEVGRSK